MKGISYLTDSSNKKVAVQIDLKTLDKFESEVEDLLDVIIAESRKEEPKKIWSTVKANLKLKM